MILCTDHGHYLGERDIWGKPGAPLFEPIAHIPMLIAARRAWRPTAKCDALSTSVDLFATLRDVFAVGPIRQTTQGVSLLPLLTGEAASVR